jgi:hypothetical protein
LSGVRIVHRELVTPGTNSLHRIYTEHGVHLEEQSSTAMAGIMKYGMTASRPSAVRSDDACQSLPNRTNDPLTKLAQPVKPTGTSKKERR